MMKRATWFVSGAAAGVVGAKYAAKKAKQMGAKLAPANLARAAVSRVHASGNTVIDAVREGRAAMKAKEQELKFRRDHEIEGIEGRLNPGDRLLVDGRPVDPERVVVVTPVA